MRISECIASEVVRSRSRRIAVPHRSRALPIAQLLVGAMLIFGVLPCVASATLQLQDYTRISTVSDPQISPDGRSIVFVLSRPDLARDSSDRHLMLIDIASGRQHTLTYERRFVSFPRWSPSGDRLAFLALDSAPKPEMQIFVLPMSGGEARQITSAPGGIEQFAWRPDGKEIAYVTADQPSNQKDIDAHHDAFVVGDNDYLTTAAVEPSHLWLVSADGGRALRLTSGSWTVAKSFPPIPASPINWSADGRLLLFTRQESPQSGDSDLATVRILDVQNRQVRKLTDHAKLESFAHFSPDDLRVAYWYPRGGDPANENEVYVTSVAGGEGASATRALDRNVLRAIWMPGGRSLLVGAHDGIRTRLWLQPIGGRATKLPLRDVDPASEFWIDISVGKSGAIAFPGVTRTHPSELYYMASADQPPRRLTSFNDGIAALHLGKVEELDWVGPKGFHEDGVVTYPLDFDGTKKYPLVVYLHGGPQEATRTGFAVLPQFLFQYLAAQGYVVLAINYRGSDNLGNAYQRAIYNDAGEGPGRDAISGVDALQKRHFIDRRRIAVVGISYGGFVSTWLIGHYSIFKAAIAQDAVTDWLDQYDLSDENASVSDEFKGSPYVGDNLGAYREQSSLTYAKRIKTPILIMHDTGDFRVPITQAYALYHVLKDNGVPVTFIAYPISSHIPFDPVRAMDSYQRWSDWLKRQLR